MSFTDFYLLLFALPVSVYVCTRLATVAYFKSRLEFLKRIREGE